VAEPLLFTIRDAIGLTLIFSATAWLAIWFYTHTLTAEQLRNRLPNRVSWASIVLLLIIGGWVWWMWHSVSGFGRFRIVIGTLFNLLVFETFFLLLMRRTRSNLTAVLAAAFLTAGLIWLQRAVGGIWVYNATFILATLGATTLLVQMRYLRTGFLVAVSLLWMIYDILSVLFVYPRIYAAADRPNTSFFYPAVAFGQVTLGSGDFMFLVLMTLVLLRDRGRKIALVHIVIQAVALIITILAKPRETLWPYLTIMVPIFLGVWLSTRKRSQNIGSVDSAVSR
jgi:hypothetical protein